MEDFLSIAPSFLYQNTNIANFPARNLSVSKELGKSSEDEKIFVNTVQEQPLSVKPQNHDINFELTTAQEAETFFNNQLIESGSFVSLKYSHLFPSVVNQPGGDKIIDFATAAFFQNNKDMVSFFNENSNLLSSLINGDIKTSDDIKNEFVGFVFDQLNSDPAITKDFLGNHFFLTKFTALNIGGVIGLLNSDNAAKKAFTGGPVFGKEIIETRIAKMASELFPNDSRYSESFFKKNMIDAVFFLKNPGEVSAVKQDDDMGKFISSRFAFFESTFKSELVDTVFNQLNTGTVFTKDFLSSNLDFTIVAAGDSLINNGHTLIQFIKENKDLTSALKPVDLNKIYISFEAKLASEKLPDNFPIDISFLEENINITFLINSSGSFTNALIEDKEVIERFVLNNSGKNEEADIQNSTRTTINKAFDSFLTGSLTRSRFEKGKSVDSRV